MKNIAILLCLYIGFVGAACAQLVTNNNQLWTQDSSGIEGGGEDGDEFGYAVATGDFNGDGYQDLLIGVPGESIGTTNNAGCINVIYGTGSGLSSAGDQQLWADTFNAKSETNDRLGFAVCSGDFNGDGYDDAVLTAPYEDIGTTNNAGLLYVLYGSVAGLTTASRQTWYQGLNLETKAETNDYFGWCVASGDFNKDGYDDLAVGIPYEDANSVVNAGAVHIIYGTANGLASNRNEFISQDTGGMDGAAETNDNFGYAVAVGDFDGDGYDDLAVGVPGEDSATVTNCGYVQIIYGASGGLNENDNTMFSQDSGSLLDEQENGDQFGRALASGDFNGDGYDDLAVGIPYENSSSVVDCGYVQVLFGASSGLKSSGDQLFYKGTAGINGTATASDQFGHSVAAGDFNGDGFDDLAVGVPYEDLTPKVNIGGANIIYGSAAGLTADGDQNWNQDRAGVMGVASNYENFAYAMATGDFNNDGAADLALGVPYDLRETGSSIEIGGVNVLYGKAVAQPHWYDGASNLGGGWYRLAWFGDFILMADNWIWHKYHGYMYCSDTSQTSMYLYTMDMGWFWTSNTSYPYMYRFNDGVWLWYQSPSVSPRWFLNLTTSLWESH